MLIYFDTCCLNRPFDNLDNDIVRLESDAVLTILNKCEMIDTWEFCSSDVLDDEIARIAQRMKRDKVFHIYQSASMHIELNEDILVRSKELQFARIDPFDALHVACAEYGGATVFLTTDNNLIHRAERIKSIIRVANPLIWLLEVLHEH